jgi:hypothetical protein
MYELHIKHGYVVVAALKETWYGKQSRRAYPQCDTVQKSPSPSTYLSLPRHLYSSTIHGC